MKILLRQTNIILFLLSFLVRGVGEKTVASCASLSAAEKVSSREGIAQALRAGPRCRFELLPRLVVEKNGGDGFDVEAVFDV